MNKEILKNFIDKYPNDQELGKAIRKYYLKEIKENKGQLFETGSEGILVFEYDKKQMNMKTYVESNQLPKQITIVYEMMGTWNRCINNFKEKNGMTAWEMDVEFRFNKPTEIPIEQFIEKTTQGMNIFKTFVEQK